MNERGNEAMIMVLQGGKNRETEVQTKLPWQLLNLTLRFRIELAAEPSVHSFQGERVQLLLSLLSLSSALFHPPRKTWIVQTGSSVAGCPSPPSARVLSSNTEKR